jgi:UTP-glucose-1-phosphate uridylyltransferase
MSELMTEQQLFERFINLELDAMAIKENVKALVEEAKENGIDKEDIALIKASAKLHVANAFEEKSAHQRALEEKYKALTGYDEDEPKF